jgi:ribonucleoside-diphosphate reductase alpha chain
LGRCPLKKEWEKVCKENGIGSEIRSNFKSWIDFKNQAIEHNHKVVCVEEDGYEDVYNGTVDEYHNMIIGGWEEITQFGRRVQRGIFSPQCGEVVLEGGIGLGGELCNISETLPTVCLTEERWFKACEYATTYCSTVALLPTHQVETNKIIMRNRRVGIGIIDFIGWKHHYGVNKVTKWLREGYKIIRETNERLAQEAGVPESIRITTMKPGGTIPKLAGKTSGAQYPNFTYMIRRMLVQRFTPIYAILCEANVPHEPDVNDEGTEAFEFPVYSGEVKPAEEVSLWEQAMNIVLLQREWSDNSVSCTLNFKPKWKLVKHIEDPEDIESELEELKSIFPDFNQPPFEDNNWKIVMDDGLKIFQYNPKHEEDDIESVLSAIAPLIKTVSLLPHTPKGVYKQMPEEGITKEEYEQRVAAIKPIDWSSFGGSDGQDERYCEGDRCIIGEGTAPVNEITAGS